MAHKLVRNGTQVGAQLYSRYYSMVASYHFIPNGKKCQDSKFVIQPFGYAPEAINSQFGIAPGLINLQFSLSALRRRLFLVKKRKSPHPRAYHDSTPWPAAPAIPLYTRGTKAREGGRGVFELWCWIGGPGQDRTQDSLWRQRRLQRWIWRQSGCQRC